MSADDATLRGIRAILLDVDGILTDNGLWVGEDGTVMKRFNILDGAGIKLAIHAGLLTGLISGHDSQATVQRANQLGMPIVHVGVKDKIPVFEKILADNGLEASEVLYMGDDLMDVPLLTRAGLAVTVPEAAPEALAVADHVTERGGGQGAVREAITWLLKRTGRYDDLVKRFL